MIRRSHHLRIVPSEPGSFDPIALRRLLSPEVQPMTEREIADELGVSRGRVSQIIKRAIEKIERAMRRFGLRWEDFR